MKQEGRIQGVAQFIYAQMPGNLLLYGSLILTFLFIGLGLIFDRKTLIFSGFILLACALLLLGLILWSSQKMMDHNSYQAQELLFSMSQSQPKDPIVYIDLGLRQGAIALSRHVTGGRLTVIDVYNPQLMPSATLAKARREAPPALLDPRIHWYDSSLELLPLPNQSTAAVFMPHILSFINQYGDQKKLLEEVHRILKDNGRLLIADSAISQQSQWPLMPLHRSNYPVTHWRTMLKEAGFEIRRTESLDRSTICLRADKPLPYAGRQMAFDLKLDNPK